MAARGLEGMRGELGVEVYPSDGARPGEALLFDVYLPVAERQARRADSGNHVLHPVQPRVGSVFVPVTDLPRATRFYSMLLGTPIDPSIRHEHLYWFQLPNGTDIILDSEITAGRGGAHPLFYLGTADIDGALAHLAGHGVEIAGELQRGDFDVPLQRSGRQPADDL